MFTNWLTGSSSSSSSSSRSTIAAATAAAGGAASGGASALVMSSPPDVILEVGPAPGSSVRFVAHSLVLGMHSGYLRSAIRLDEAAVVAANANSTTTTTPTGELLLYLSNVTADQFAPLLTYMYTGYLDLTVDNIFAVLLATHVLHMPRALEICRSFLARAQTEGYLNGNPPAAQLCPVAPAPSNAKVIRPIPSKATLPNYGFLPLPQAAAAVPPPPHPPPPPPNPTALCPFGGAPGATLQQEEPLSLGHYMHDAEEDEDKDEDVEVFIDSNTVTDNEAEPEPDVDMDCNVSVVSSLAGSSAGSLNIERLDVKPPSPAAPPPPVVIIAAPPKPQKVPSTNKKDKSRSKGSSSRNRKPSNGLQVARAPVPAAQLEMGSTGTTSSSSSKFIIDVASCDGPVRFRRILNTAYGHKPEDLNGGVPGHGAGSGSGTGLEQHRSQQSVSYSFHQQMARAISSQQRQMSQQQLEESENSGDAGSATATTTTTISNTTTTTTTPSRQQQKANSNATSTGSSSSTSTNSSSASSAAASHQELYVCVYCKHTFKSQYCYQKHAKRHLNPLSLTTAATTTTDKKLLLAVTEPLELEGNSITASGGAAGTGISVPGTAANNNPTGGSVGGAGAGGGGGALLRREVRPLDMNVQYYPCKTCGSKFPSYYFVHKHRKMCHADEIEAAAAAAASTATSNTNSSNSSHGSNNSHSKKEQTAASVTVAMETGEDQQQQQHQD
ncbi:insulinoma-associated protein 1 [Drosophila bipectinata]|uniref:insulinoma-associated protein 1 n=1 Tax=Drosophila bipectinata TaxID=42026 RepID=UPI001C8A3995|nr:mucin-19 [Drosophila bipectinata]